MHGCIKSKNDCNVIENSAKALLGFLAQKKLDSISSMSEVRPPNLCSMKRFFAECELFDASQCSKSHVLKVTAVFDSDFLAATSEKIWYLGVRAQPSENCGWFKKVLSGEMEFQSGAAHNMVNLQVVHVINNLPPCVAWTIESHCIEKIAAKVFSRLVNKSSSFGLGCSNAQSLYTVTLLRGSAESVEYSAYSLPDNAPELHSLVQAGVCGRENLLLCL
jgi:hypothetical protein